MSDTPRTDADCWDTIAGAARCKPSTEHAYVPATLARQLERENAELRQRLAVMKSLLFVVQTDLEPADREPAALMLGDGIPAALLRAARKEDKP